MFSPQSACIGRTSIHVFLEDFFTIWYIWALISAQLKLLEKYEMLISKL